MKEKKPEVGAWETDELGRRFRRIGNCIEYEPTITTSNGTVRASALASHNEAMAKVGLNAEATAEKPTSTICPFKRGMSNRCDGERCAMYMDGCALRKLATGLHAKETRGQRCPFLVGGACIQKCELYSNGCKLTAVK